MKPQSELLLRERLADKAWTDMVDLGGLVIAVAREKELVRLSDKEIEATWSVLGLGLERGGLRSCFEMHILSYHGETGHRGFLCKAVIVCGRG